MGVSDAPGIGADRCDLAPSRFLRMSTFLPKQTVAVTVSA